MHQSLVLPASVRLREWQPDLPPGDLRAIALHWTAGDYDTVYPAYHVCLRGSVDVHVVQTHDLRANMRDLRSAAPGAYAAHVAGRNSWTIGIAVCAMGGATPFDFGRWPLTRAQLDALAYVARVLAERYAIALGAIRTHAEAALEDGYFGADGDDCRWDIARLEPNGAALEPSEVTATGNALRERIAAVTCDRN